MARSELQDPVSVREVVSVPERGHTDVSKCTWDKIESSDGFRRLLDRGILEASILPGRGFRLHGSCYVGRAQCGEVVLELREKIEGALVSLLSHATHAAFRIERARASASELGGLIALLVHQFLDATSAYASRGREFVYAVERHIGSLVGGRIDIAGSLQLRARGLGHLLAFEKNAIKYNTPVNRIVLSALREIERLNRLVGIAPEDLVRARGLAMLFADCRDAEILFARRSTLVSQAQAVLDSPLPPPVRDMVALAGVLLAHESFEHSTDGDPAVPRSWFLNLENLFETAVRNVLADQLGSSCSVTRGGEHARRVFEHATTEYTAHPDLVLGKAQSVEAIGDVKYKAWDGSAALTDVYQLLVHASAFGCKRAFLVFPSDQFEVRSLGRASTDCDVTFFSVDVRDLPRDIGRLIETLGLSSGAARLEPEAAPVPVS